MIRSTPIFLLYRNRFRRALFLNGRREYASYINLRAKPRIIPSGAVALTYVNRLHKTVGMIHLYQMFNEIFKDDSGHVQHCIDYQDIYDRRKNCKRLHFAVVRKMMAERGFWLVR